SQTRAAAATPHLFGIIASPKVLPQGADYLAIPRHVAEDRTFFPVAHYSPDVITSSANFVAADPDGFAFAVLSSSMFIAWMRAVGGRIKSDLRFSSTFTYNTFPLRAVPTDVRAKLCAAGEAVLAARAAHPG